MTEQCLDCAQGSPYRIEQGHALRQAAFVRLSVVCLLGISASRRNGVLHTSKPKHRNPIKHHFCEPTVGGRVCLVRSGRTGWSMTARRK
jgi:hypothetical protein